MKPVVGSGAIITQLPLTLVVSDELLIEPETILDKRYDSEGFLEVLIKWKHLPDHESSWLRVGEFKHKFPTFSLEDKLSLADGGIDMPLRVYTRKEKEGERRKETSVENKNDELADLVTS